MTLPFRRRHHDDDAWHDRARALFSAELLGPLDEADQAWLDHHLERCRDCRVEREGFVADRDLLRGLRDRPPVPPRDLWARTAAEIERQNPAMRARRGPLGLSLPPVSSKGLPYGPLAGVLVAVVVLVVAVQPRGGAVAPSQVPPASQVAISSTAPGATPIEIAAADKVGWITSTPDGQYTIVFADVSQVCGEQSEGCAALAAGSPAPIELGAPPQAVVLSPSSQQVVVVPAAGDTVGSVVILDVPTPRPSGSVAPSATSASPTATPAAPTATASATATGLPTQSPAGTGLASAAPSPVSGGHSIISGVVVVGEASYSDDGSWLAFSAKPIDGTRGPDLYVWHVGDAVATRLSDNGATYFSGWFGNRILASGIILPASDDAAASPTPDASPAVTPAATAASPGSPAPLPSPAEVPTPAPPLEAHPYSFLLDPATGDRAVFAQPDVWLPSIDRTGRFVVYWSGTVTPAGVTVDASLPPSPAPSDGTDLGQVAAWRPATGRLVLDGWSTPIVSPEPSPESSGAEPTGEPGPVGPTLAPTASPTAALSESAAASGLVGSPEPSQPVVAEGPAGTPMTLADGPLADFAARFDPTGTRLAIWTADPDNADIGPLWLVVLDPALGSVKQVVQPLEVPGVVSLRGFSLKDGWLGWVTPEGQDGEPSSVHVLGWSGETFGEVKTVPGGNLQIVR